MTSAAKKRPPRGTARAASPASRIVSAADVADMEAATRRLRHAETTTVRNLSSLHNDAWQHGYRQGVQQALSEVKDTLVELQAFRSNPSSRIGELVLAILRKVLGECDAASIVPSIAAQVVRECDRQLEALAVHVHPDLLQPVEARLAAIAVDGLRLDVVPDEKLGETGCEVHTLFGIIKADLDTQLTALERAAAADAADVADD